MNPDNTWTYDIETFKSCFCVVFKHHGSGKYKIFEWSIRKNEISDLLVFIKERSLQLSTMVSYNGLGFDVPVIHWLVKNYCDRLTVQDVYNKAMSIINTPWDQRFSHIIWTNDRLMVELDLCAMNHYNNIAKLTSLKILEFNMRMGSIADLPYPPDSELNEGQIQNLVGYCKHDVDATEMFLNHCTASIDLREKLGVDLNWDDTKIGKGMMQDRLEAKSPGICFTTAPKRPRQTIRQQINIGEVLLPYLKFNHPEFQRIHQWFKERTITETKGAINDLTAEIDGLKYVYGTGGLHASREDVVYKSNEEYAILDLDYSSYYPNIAIANRLYPEHLNESFCDSYQELYVERKKYAKKTPKNLAVKLALNSTFGNAGNKYSFLLDIKYLMAITVNGQMILTMLADELLKIPYLKMLQCNTDGLTVRIKRSDILQLRMICRQNEQITGLELEEAEYDFMALSNVNNYLAEYTNGKVKRKGKYEYKLGWHQNHSALVVPKAAEAFLIHGTEPVEFIKNHDDMLDFCLRTKVPRSSKLMLGDVQQQNVTRYIITKHGDEFVKVMPPTKNQTDKNPEAPDRRIGINKGFNVTVCNDLSGFYTSDINFDWYISETEKLISYAR